MSRNALALLIFCNFVWAMNPLMGKVLVADFHGVQVAWFRYATAFLIFFLIAATRVVFFRRSWSEYFLVPKNIRTCLELGVIGVGPFVFSPIMQFVGLETAQAIDNSILVATEPLLTVVLARGVLGEKMNRNHMISMGMALIGFFFFTGIFSVGVCGLSVGVLFLLMAQAGEGAYSVFAKKLVVTHRPTAILGSALGLGAIILTLFTASFDRIPYFGKLSTTGIGAVLWLGPLGSTLTYLIWTTVSRRASVASMAITLFIQPVVGSFMGYVLLGERLTIERLFGAILILAGIAYLAAVEVQDENRSVA